MMRIPMRLTLLALLFLVSSALYAQQSQRESSRPSRQGLSRVQAAYIAKQLGFDEATTRRFVELYAKQQQEIWALSPRDKATKGARTDAEAERAIKDYFERSEQLLSIRKKYYQEFRNFLSPQQIERIYKLDRRTIEELRRQARAFRQTHDSTLRYMGDSLSRVYRLDPRVIKELQRQARDVSHSYDSIQHHMGDQLERARRFYHRGRR